MSDSIEEPLKSGTGADWGSFEQQLLRLLYYC